MQKLRHCFEFAIDIHLIGLMMCHLSMSIPQLVQVCPFSWQYARERQIKELHFGSSKMQSAESTEIVLCNEL